MGSWNGSAKVWHVQSERCLAILTKHEEDTDMKVTSVAITDDGKWAACDGLNGTFQVWEVDTGRSVTGPIKSHNRTVNCMESFGEGRKLVTGGYDGDLRGELRVWNTATGAGSWDRSIRIWDARTGAPVGHPLQGHTGYVSGIVVTPDGLYIVSVSSDETVRMWDLRRRSLLHTFTGHIRGTRCVAISPHGDYAVTGSSDRTVRLWNLQSMDGSDVVLEGHSRDVERVFVSDDGLRINSVDFHGIIFVWDIKTKKQVRSLWFEGFLEGFLEEWPHSAHRIRLPELAKEPSASSSPAQSIRVVGRRQIVLSDEPDSPVLATLEEDFWALDLSPDEKAICLGLGSGKLAFLNVEISKSS